MSAQATTQQLARFEILKSAQKIIRQEAQALSRLAQQIPIELEQAVKLLCQCQGSAIVTGIGKAGWIGQKVSATLASTGTRSHYLHPGEAQHGDLGRVGSRDVVIVLSNSGETDELLKLIPALEGFGVPMISIVGNQHSALARASTVVLAYGNIREACALGLAPSTSTTLMLALGDALALVTSQSKGFQATDFAKFHPGGNLGKMLSTVDEVMRPISACRVAIDQETVREIYVRLQGPDRRSGAILLTDEMNRLSGLFTDSDLARLLERGQDSQLDLPIIDVMTTDPITVCSGTKTQMAVAKLAAHNISELPVVNSNGRPIGVIDITDVLSLLPRD